MDEIEALNQAADIVNRIAKECRAGDHGDEWTSRDVRDALEFAADEIKEYATGMEYYKANYDGIDVHNIEMEEVRRIF